MVVPALLSLVVLQFVSGAVEAQANERFPINIVVKNTLLNPPSKGYETEAGIGWILLGVMNELAKNNSGFSFTYEEDEHYGPYLESINGYYPNKEEHKYWELKVKTANGIIRPDVGIGCYIPNPHDTIIFNCTSW